MAKQRFTREKVYQKASKPSTQKLRKRVSLHLSVLGIEVPLKSLYKEEKREYTGRFADALCRAREVRPVVETDEFAAKVKGIRSEADLLALIKEVGMKRWLRGIRWVREHRNRSYRIANQFVNLDQYMMPETYLPIMDSLIRCPFESTTDLHGVLSVMGRMSVMQVFLGDDFDWSRVPYGTLIKVEHQPNGDILLRLPDNAPHVLYEGDFALMSTDESATKT